MQALGGAKNHLVVMPDADLDQTVEALMGSAYGSAGERCMAVSVAVAVGDEVADALVDRLAPRVRDLRIGSFREPEAEMGPLVTGAHRDPRGGLRGRRGGGRRGARGGRAGGQPLGRRRRYR